MTREEILAMKPGRELDALVAEKVMGECKHDFIKSGPNVWNHQCQKCGIMDSNFSQSTLFIAGTDKAYSTDISAEWEVVEKMRRPFSSRMKFSKALQYIMNQELIESEAEIRIAPHEIIWHMTPLNISKAALLACLEVE